MFIVLNVEELLLIRHKPKYLVIIHKILLRPTVLLHRNQLLMTNFLDLKREIRDEIANWHKQYLETLEKKLQSQPNFTDKYKIRNSNNERLYLPDKPNIGRQEILSNPDMILVNNKTKNFDFIIEVEYQINYKKIVGISILTGIAVRKMKPKYSSTLVLITKEDFPNSKMIEKEIQAYDKNIKLHLTHSTDFSWIGDILDFEEE